LNNILIQCLLWLDTVNSELYPDTYTQGLDDYPTVITTTTTTTVTTITTTTFYDIDPITTSDDIKHTYTFPYLPDEIVCMIYEHVFSDYYHSWINFRQANR